DRRRHPRSQDDDRSGRARCASSTNRENAMNRWLARGALMAITSTLVLAGGCAQSRDPINRVQPNAYDKHFFAGQSLSDAGDDPEFFWRNYVVDASATQSLVGVGSWGHVDRVRWEVTENLLLARKAYQIADG